MTSVDRIARIRIELDGIDPSIWRRIEVPLTTSLKGLHEIIQAVMLFENYHLFHFEVGDKRYGIPDPEWDHGPAALEAKNIKLGALVERGRLSSTLTCTKAHRCLLPRRLSMPARRARRNPSEGDGGDLDDGSRD